MKKWLIPALVAVTFQVVLGASPSFGYQWTLQDPFFISKDAIDVSTVISPPPTHGSIEEKTDFDKLKDYQRTRTAKECERSAYEVEVSLEHLFGPKYGPLSEAEVTKLAPFMDKVRNDVDFFVQKIKKKWDRPRPYMADPSLSPCVKREVTNAYPSGHAAISRVFADVLSKWDPSREAVFHARAERIAEDRVLSGVHHPADIAAGKKAGDVIFGKLSASPSFEKELHSLKTGG